MGVPRSTKPCFDGRTEMVNPFSNGCAVLPFGGDETKETVCIGLPPAKTAS